MTPRRPDPSDSSGLPRDLDSTAEELERFAALSAGESPHGLADRVMSAVATEPTPRRGILATLLGPFALGADSGMTRMVLVAGTVVLAVLAVVVAGRLGDLFRDQQIGPSPAPSVIVSPVESPTATPSPTPAPTPSRTPRPSPSASPSDEPSRSPEAESPDPTASDDDDDSSGPGGGDDRSETPEPSEDDNSGSGGGDDSG